MGMTYPEKNHTFFINTRFALIVLVVFGNLLMPLMDRFPEAKALIEWIFTFHIPVFVLVTGYFSKGFWEHKDAPMHIAKIAWQYVLFQSLYSLADYYFFRTPDTTYSFWSPYWMLWFLFSHLGWKLLLVPFRKLRHPMLAAILLGVLVGYLPVDGAWLSLSRTLVFFPFFLAGYLLQPGKLLRLAEQLPVRVGAAVFLVGTYLVFAGGLIQIDLGWLLGSRTFGSLQHHEWYAGVLRIGVYALEGAAALAFLLLQSSRKSTNTDWGTRTLYVFLLHGSIIKVLTLMGLYAWFDQPVKLVLLLLLGMTITVLLSQPRVMLVTKAWIDPRIELVWTHVRGKLLQRH
jgi:fucose 4-O-acetylase-like acetyltransferase